MQGLLLAIINPGNNDPMDVAAAAVTVAIGGRQALDMVRLHGEGVGLRTIGKRYGVSAPTAARRIREAEQVAAEIQGMIDNNE